jgi:polyisoprenoid-binding protein YceI
MRQEYAISPLLGLFVAVGLLIAGLGQTPLAAQEKPESYTVDNVHSSVLFKVKHANAAYFFGRFIEVSGDIDYDRSDPAEGSVSLTVQADSVRTWNKKRDDHLKSPDFLNVKQFPEITFDSVEIEKTGDNKFSVTGDFSLHGKTVERTIDVRMTGEGKGPEGNPRIGFYTEFDLQRSEFGMTKYMGMIGDTVTLIISIEGVSK